VPVAARAAWATVAVLVAVPRLCEVMASVMVVVTG
jgi:hypothetical protein